MNTQTALVINTQTDLVTEGGFITITTLRNFCKLYYKVYGLEWELSCTNQYEGKQNTFEVTTKHGTFYLGTAKQAIQFLIEEGKPNYNFRVIITYVDNTLGVRMA